ncbi:MAG TPA: GNAT family N-acetyltransferase [Acidimicrobiales bacterium]|jgi:ribosomal-protein-alanine N-acetyltransferase|nr:GNAT family N-acetyltransferase [Acidimicrobiales bacterium]
MPELVPLDAAHARAVLAFELANRAYFARAISDRGDQYFADFHHELDERLAEQAAGGAAFYVLVDDDGSVLGRFNLNRIHDGVAELGYRVAERAAGKGVATRTVVQLGDIATAEHGLHRLRAACSDANVASRKVLTNAGFTEVGRADPSDIGGKQGSWFERDLRADP